MPNTHNDDCDSYICIRRSRLTNLRHFLSDHWWWACHCAQEAENYYVGAPPRVPQSVLVVWLFTRTILFWAFTPLICRFRGHIWDGGFGVGCMRCGRHY